MEIKVILYKPAIAGNIGFIARVMANFGCRELFLIEPQCDHLSTEAKRFAKRAQDVLESARVISSPDATDADIIIATSAKRSAGTYNVLRMYQTPKELNRNLKKDSKVAILFGPEDKGLSNKIIEKCDSLLHIPTSDYRALNLSHSVAIVLYELLSGEFEYREMADKDENSAVFDYFESISKKAYSREDESKRRTALTVIKRVLSRAILQKREAHTLCGFLSRIKELL